LTGRKRLETLGSNLVTMIESINIEDIAPFVSALFMFSLGTVAWFSGRKELLWRLLAIFCYLLTATSVFVFLASTSPEITKTLLYTRLTYFVAILSILLAVYYTDVLTDQYKKIPFFKWKISARTYFAATAMIGAAILILLLSTKLLISGFEMNHTGEYQVSYGPISYPILILIVLGMVKISYSINLAYRKSSDINYREFLKLNNLAFHLIYMPSLLVEFIRPDIGIPIQVVVFTAFPVAVTIFYIAILRYQFAHVNDLTIGLEKKVEERTAELKQAQAKLTQSDKMASLGLLVASVAHEINNPIGSVRSMQNSLTLAVDKLRVVLDNAPDETRNNQKLQDSLRVIDDATRVIDKGTERVADFVRKLKNFISLDQSGTQAADIRQGIEEAIMLIRPRVRDKIKIKTEFDDIPIIKCAPSQLNQVFLNMLVNSAQAIDNEGEIIVGVREYDQKLRISIGDNGCGISQENLNKIYDPGFTTKEDGLGIGLGLSISYQIIHDHNGTIVVESEPGIGTTFTIELPIDYDFSEKRLGAV